MHKEAAPVADEITKADLDAVTAERDTLQAEIQSLKDADPKDIAALLGLELAKSADTEEDFYKGLPEPVRERLEKAEKDAADTTARIAKMEADARHAVVVAKAADYADLGDVADLVPALSELGETEAAKALDRFLKAAAARTNTALFGEVGSVAGESDDVAKAKVRAEEIRKENPDVDEATALRQAMSENPEAAAKAFARK